MQQDKKEENFRREILWLGSARSENLVELCNIVNDLPAQLARELFGDASDNGNAPLPYNAPLATENNQKYKK